MSENQLAECLRLLDPEGLEWVEQARESAREHYSLPLEGEISGGWREILSEDMGDIFSYRVKIGELIAAFRQEFFQTEPMRNIQILDFSFSGNRVLLTMGRYEDSQRIQLGVRIIERGQWRNDSYGRHCELTKAGREIIEILFEHGERLAKAGGLRGGDSILLNRLLRNAKNQHENYDLQAACLDP